MSEGMDFSSQLRESELRTASGWQDEACRGRQEIEALKQTLHHQRMAHAAVIMDLEVSHREVRQLQLELQELRSCNPKFLSQVHG